MNAAISFVREPLPSLWGQNPGGGLEARVGYHRPASVASRRPPGQDSDSNQVVRRQPEHEHPPPRPIFLQVRGGIQGARDRSEARGDRRRQEAQTDPSASGRAERMLSWGRELLSFLDEQGTQIVRKPVETVDKKRGTASRKA
jgi:hypothetical protein